MNTPEKNNYIQYVNKNGIVKAKNVVFDKGEETTTFTVSGIDEEFFIFAIYENNIQRFCVGIENLENTDMLGFINSNMVDLSCIPEYAFLQPQTSVEFSYNNEYVENFRHGVQSGPGASDSSTDPDDLKYLKSYLQMWFGSLDGFYIEPKIHHQAESYTSSDWNADSGSIFFGKIVSEKCSFSCTHIAIAVDVETCFDGQVNVFCTSVSPSGLEGLSYPFSLVGYAVYHDTHFS